MRTPTFARVVLLTAGTSANGYTYSEEALRGALESIQEYDGLPLVQDAEIDIESGPDLSASVGYVRNIDYENESLVGDVSLMGRFDINGAMLGKIIEGSMVVRPMSRALIPKDNIIREMEIIGFNLIPKEEATI